MGEVIRVLLADDHPALRVGLRVLLDQAPDVEVVGEAGSGEEALAQIETLQPDVAVLDCLLPSLAGAEVAAKVQRQGLPTRVLALSAYEDEKYVRGMLEAGAVGYLLKSEAPERIVAAVRAAARGEGYFSPAVAAQMAAWVRGEGREGAGLTERELEVLRLMARGWDNRRIAQELVISEGTVKNHVTNIYAKLGVRSRAGAVAWAWQQGLVSPEDE